MAYNTKLRRELCRRILSLVNDVVASVKGKEDKFPQDLQEPIERLAEYVERPPC